MRKLKTGLYATPFNSLLSVKEMGVAKKDKALKEGGEIITLTAPYHMPNLEWIPEGAQLKECKDGWFEIVVNENKRHYRIGPQTAEAIRKTEWQENIEQ